MGYGGASVPRYALDQPGGLEICARRPARRQRGKRASGKPLAHADRDQAHNDDGKRRCAKPHGEAPLPGPAQPASLAVKEDRNKGSREALHGHHLEHAVQELSPGEAPGAGGGRVVARVDGHRCAVGGKARVRRAERARGT
jgi:hypothetical protein